MAPDKPQELHFKALAHLGQALDAAMEIEDQELIQRVRSAIEWTDNLRRGLPRKPPAITPPTARRKRSA